MKEVCENMLLKNYCAAINRLTTAPVPALVFHQALIDFLGFNIRSKGTPVRVSMQLLTTTPF